LIISASQTRNCVPRGLISDLPNLSEVHMNVVEGRYKNTIRISDAIGLQRESLLLSLTVAQEVLTGNLNSMCVLY